MSQEYTERGKRQVLQDLTIRARGGVFIYLATWVITAIWADIPGRFPLFFYLNTVVFVVLAMLRTGHYLVYKKYPGADTDTMYGWLVATILASASHWGLLAAWIINDSDLLDLKTIYLIGMAAFAIGGASTLSISRIVRLIFPLLILGPSILSGLYFGDSELRILILLAVFSLIYLYEASRVTSRDYWAAVTNHELARNRAKAMEQLSNIDTLTQLRNRPYFDSKFSQDWKLCSRTHSPLSILMLDLDSFKTLNDRYGHAFGDTCLKEVASTMTKVIQRETDTLARYGGDEFVVLLPDTSLRAAEIIADKLVKNIFQAQLFHNKKLVSISCSIGVSSTVPSLTRGRESLLEAADKALYHAKEKGRNQYRVL